MVLHLVLLWGCVSYSTAGENPYSLSSHARNGENLPSFNTYRINRTRPVFPALYQEEGLVGQVDQSLTLNYLPTVNTLGSDACLLFILNSASLTSMKQACSVYRWQCLRPVIYLPRMLHTVMAKIYVKESQASAAYCTIVDKNPYIFGVMMCLPRLIKFYLIFHFPCCSLMYMP